MVHLNGSALPDQDFNQLELNGSHALRAAQDPLPRRVRASQTSRGPKPLLPRSLKEALQLAELLSKSKLIPKGFETPETCLVGILYGMEVGLSPIAALQRMAVIDGRPTIWGDAALALVQASGLLQSIKEQIVEEPRRNADAEALSADGSIASFAFTPIAPTTNLTAICTVRREGRAETIIGTFSIDDAKRAGLWQKPGPWTDYPKRMLIMRARAFALRDAFPDVLAGLYIREEFEGSERRNVGYTPASAQADNEWNDLENETKTFGETNLQTSKVRDGNQAQEAAPAIRRAPPPPPERSNQTDETTIEPELQSHHIESIAERQNPIETAADEQSSAAEEPLDPETILDLLDSALCCALDLPTLEEIVDDFAQRLKGLSKDHQKRAQKIIDRHYRRVEDLDRSFGHGKVGDLDEGQSPGGPVTVHDDHAHALDNSKTDRWRGLDTLLPNLGLGFLPTSGRRRKTSRRKRQSLASWNERQRLQEFGFTDMPQSDTGIPDDTEAQP